MYKEDAMNMEIPEIRKARMIDTRRLEVFWSQAVVNSQYSENIGVYHKGRRIATYERSDDEAVSYTHLGRNHYLCYLSQ